METADKYIKLCCIIYMKFILFNMFDKKKIITLLFLILTNFASAESDLLSFLATKKDFSTFYQLIKIAKYEQLFNEKTQFKKIVYIPNNQAFKKLPKKIKDKIMNEDIAKKIIRTHLFSGEVKEVFKDPKKKVVIIERIELNGEAVKIFGNNDLFVKDVVNQKNTFNHDNSKIVPIDCVMYLQQSIDDNRLSKEEKKNSLVTSCCLLTDQEIEKFFQENYI